ncbi:hypothetical protein [uncultured Draconibacterium sp.]|uniref:phenylacetate--CoA ligase family protein n=1 Tax=uncultured Draconibacterium sp. TaxID=1573823 RepID=UPI0025F4365E|nr:hypothetical protein [uncultured Draconibacterium sp.]
MIIGLLKYYIESKVFQLLPAEQVQKIHIKRFRKVFEWAREHSEFYRKLYQQAGIMDLTITNLDDIQKVPLVTKEMMLAHHRQDVLTIKLTDELIVTSSSGSTGKPFDVHWSKKEYFKSYVRTFLALPFYNPFRRFVFIGLFKQKEIIERKSFLSFCQRHLRLFRRENYSVLTPFNEIAQSLYDRKIGVLSSTNSCLFLLVEELKKHKKKLRVNYVVVSGETLSDALRHDLKTYLNAKVVDVYGCTELTSMSWSVPDKSVYNYALNSVMPECLNPQKINGEYYGEFVFTNFVNKTMPFIRYRVGDQIARTNNYKKMGRVSGRNDDIMLLNNGRKVFMYQLYIFFNPLGGFVQYKFLQRKDKTIVFQAIGKPGIDKQKLARKIKETWLLNYGTHPFEVEFKEELPINKTTGKFKRVEVEL